MTINFTELFTRLGKFLQTGKSLATALGTTVHGDVDGSLQGLGDALPTRYEAVRENMLSSLGSLQSAGGSAISGLVASPTRNLLLLTVNDDLSSVTSEAQAIRELIRQMQAEAESLDASSVSVTLSFDAGNIGTGEGVASVKTAAGNACEFAIGEEILGVVTAVDSSGIATFEVTGEPAVGLLSPLWPKGSGARSSLVSKRASSRGNLIVNGEMELADSNSAHLPAGWLATTATLGTTLKLTSIEVQTVVITGTPTGGYYSLKWENGAGQVASTTLLPWNASQQQVQSALQAIPGLERITVVSTGTSPNMTHTITFTGVTDPGQLTSVNALTGGSSPTISHNTTTAGSAHVLRGARSLELDSNGSELTTILTPVTLAPATRYAFNLFLKADVEPAAGLVEVSLLNGIGGATLTNAIGDSSDNELEIAAADITTTWKGFAAIFSTPSTMPAQAYLQIRIATAITSGTSLFLDEIYLGPIDELYADGPSLAVFDGEDSFLVGDRLTLAVTNDRAGEMHEWMNRIFNLRENRLQLPTVSDGSETIEDTLIT